MKRTKKQSNTEEEHISLSFTSLLQAVSSEAFLTVNKKMIIELGPESAVLLSNLVDKYRYYKKKEKLRKGGWFYSTNNEQQKNCGLSEWSLRKCKKELIKYRLIKTKKMGTPAKLYYKINEVAILILLEHGLAEVRRLKPSGEDSSGQDLRIPHVSIYKKNNIKEKKKKNRKKEDGKLLDVEEGDTPYEEKMWNEFDRFYNLYPRNGRKQAARDNWEKIFNKGPKKERPGFHEIFKGLEDQLPIFKARDTKYVPYARTWLDERSWEDQLESEAESKKKKTSIGYQEEDYEHRGPDETW